MWIDPTYHEDWYEKYIAAHKRAVGPNCAEERLWISMRYLTMSHPEKDFRKRYVLLHLIQKDAAVLASDIALTAMTELESFLRREEGDNNDQESNVDPGYKGRESEGS